jgi:gas vesicle protein/type III secretory pathway component EscS
MKNVVKREIARTTPNKLLKSLPYWIRDQRPFLVVLIVAVIVVFIFVPYTYSPFTSYTSYLSNLFNLCIHSLGIWGVIITAKAVATVEVERAIANEIKGQGEEYIRLLKSGQVGRMDLSKMEEYFLPGNKTEPALAMSRLFRHICKEAENLRFESSIDVVEPYRDESIESIFTINNIQKIALRAGILGTFIGLLEAITNLAKIQGEIVEVIGNLSRSLFISFSTSVAGLEVAILLGSLLMILRKQQDVYFRDMESSVEVILSLARNANNDDQSRVLGELAQVSSLIEQLGKRIYEHTQEIQHTIGMTHNRIKEQTDEIHQGIQQLKQAKLEFDSFIAEISKVQGSFISEVKDIYEKLSLKEFKDSLRDSIIFAGMSISNGVIKNEELIGEQTAQIKLGIDELIETHSKFMRFLKQIDDSQKRFIERVIEAQDNVPLLDVSTELRDTLNLAVKQVEKVSIAIEKTNDSLNRPLMERIRRNFLS